MTANRISLYFNAACLILWAIMLPITLITHLKSSVPYVAAISVWALIAAHFVGTIASKLAVDQEKTHDKLDAIHRHVKPR